MSLFWKLVLCAVIVGITAFAQPVVNEGGVLNAASYMLPGLPGHGIAQGSMFIAFGRNLGPASLVQATSFPLPTTQGLAGTSIRVTVAGVTTNAIMIYTVAGQAAAILSSQTPVGEGTLTVTYQGQTSAPVRIRVVRSAFGVFTRNQAGSGPAIVQNVNSEADRPVNALTDVARPGQVMILWGTGLGPVSGNEAAAPLPGDMDIPTEVLVGGRLARVIYKGRSGCCAGIDQIVFEVPTGVEGCYVPVVVRTGSIVSNFTTMSIAARGRSCSDPTGFTEAELDRVARGESLRIGTIDLSRVRTQFVAPPPIGTIDMTTDSGGAVFQRYTPAELIASQGYSGSGSGFGTISLGSCTVFTSVLREDMTPVDPIRPAMLDAGTALTVTGPRGAKQLTRQGAGEYYAELGGGAPNIPGFPGGTPEYLVRGSYTVDNGAGGRDVGAFRAPLIMGDPLNWTNQSAISNIPRAQDLAITWSGGDPAKQFLYMIGISGSNSAKVMGIFLCTERLAAGRFTVPSYVLSQLPLSEMADGVSTGFLGVGTSYLANEGRFTAPGLDIGWITHSENILKGVNYR